MWRYLKIVSHNCGRIKLQKMMIRTIARLYLAAGNATARFPANGVIPEDNYKKDIYYKRV
jgi:hypothetical protein